MAIGVLVPLISQYLKGIGFSGTEIGAVTATSTTVAIFASAFWGRIYTAARRRHRLVLLLCLIAAAIALGLMHIRSFPLFLLSFAVLYFFQAPVMSLSDALAIDDRRPFGFVRMFGAVGFAVGVFAAARIADAAGLAVIFPIYCCSYIAAAAVIGLIAAAFGRGEQGGRRAGRRDAAGRKEQSAVPAGDGRAAPAEGGQNGRGGRGAFRALLHNRRYLMMILCAFFFCGTNVANNTYFSFLYLQGGGALAGVGLAFLLMAGSEAPVMAWTGWLSRRLTPEKLILAAMVISAARFAWYAMSPPYYLLLALFFLQGLVNGVILVEFVNYAARLVRSELSGLAISVYYSFSSSGSTIVCQLFGGLLLDRLGPGGVYLFFSLMNLAGLLLYLFFGLWKPVPAEAGAADDSAQAPQSGSADAPS